MNTKPPTALAIASIAAIALFSGACTAICDAPQAGHHTLETVQDIVRPSHSNAVTMIQNRILAVSCHDIVRRYGKAACMPSRIDYDIVFNSRDGRSWFVHRFPDYELVNNRGRTPPKLRAWLDVMIDSRYCNKANTIFGKWTCDSKYTDYTIRYIRTGGKTRTIVDLTVPVFVTGQYHAKAGGT